jgi:hypothetical protein
MGAQPLVLVLVCSSQQATKSTDAHFAEIIGLTTASLGERLPGHVCERRIVTISRSIDERPTLKPVRIDEREGRN